MEPTLARTVAELDEALMPSRLANSPVAHVPTMGALHAGHQSLFRRARDLGDTLVASVFVNPTQFVSGEDLGTYPRSLDADLAAAGAAGVDVVFAPDVATVHPDDTISAITVDPGPLGGVYEGAERPAHFRGVLTVVAQFFALIRPSHAVFGEKDYQQLVLVRRMVRDLHLGVHIVAGTTVRDADGVALSSRNARLDPSQRSQATCLQRALRAGARQASFGAEAVVAAAAEVLAENGVASDYLALIDPQLGPPPQAGEARLLVAADFGGTRLIDNVGLVLGPGGGPIDTSLPLPNHRRTR